MQDADLIDAIGAVGIGRCFSFGGGRNRDLFGIVNDTHVCTRDEYIAQDESKNDKKLSGVQHFFDKLLRIQEMMTTSAGSIIAQRRQLAMLTYLSTLADELCEAGSTDGFILKTKLQSFPHEE